MPFKGPFEDRLAIHELIAAYADGITTRDLDAWTALWAEDAEWRIPFIPGMDHVKGRDAIMAACDATLKAADNMLIVASLGSLEVTGDTARGRAYPLETIFQADGTMRTLYGRYDDDYVRQDGTWLFQNRTYTSLHVAGTKPG